jgi:hypothetical protein
MWRCIERLNNRDDVRLILLDSAPSASYFSVGAGRRAIRPTWSFR